MLHFTFKNEYIFYCKKIFICEIVCNQLKYEAYSRSEALQLGIRHTIKDKIIKIYYEYEKSLYKYFNIIRY